MGYYYATSADLPTSTAPQPDTLVDDTNHQSRLLQFDAAADEAACWAAYIPSTYGSGGLTVTIYWLSTATSGDVKWSIAFERGNTALDVASFATAKTVTTTASGTALLRVTSAVTFTDGEIDGAGANEEIRVQIKRLGSDVADTCAADAGLHGFSIYE